MANTTIRVETPACYRGQAVTVVGDVRAGLLAVAGYGTPQQLAIAAIAVKRRGGRPVYRVPGHGRWTADLNRVACAAVRGREARDDAG